MKKLVTTLPRTVTAWSVTLCLCCLTAKAATTTISSLPQITAPSTNTYFEVADMSATPKSRKLSIGDLRSTINSTNLTLSVNGTNATTPNITNSANVTWSKNGSNLSASAISSVSVNATNTTTPNFQDSATVTWSKSGSNITAAAAGGDPAAPINNFYSTNNFFLSGKGNTLIITQVVQFAWTTLTMSGSNVSAINLTNGTFFKLTLTNDAFMVAPINFPGTNFGNTIQLHVAQDGTGGRSLTLTNSSWQLSGSGTSSNAVASITTNANAVSILTFATSPFSSTKLYGVTSPF